MCIAIPPPDSSRRARGPWGWLTATPGRLLPFGALLQGALLPLALAAPVAVPQPVLAAVWLLEAVLPFLLFGWLLESLPARLQVGEPDYLRYGGLFFLLNGGWVLVLLGGWAGAGWSVAGWLMLLAGWLGVLGMLREWRRWAPAAERPAMGRRVVAVALGTVGLLALPLAAAEVLPWAPALVPGALALLLGAGAGVRLRTPAVAQRS